MVHHLVNQNTTVINLSITALEQCMTSYKNYHIYILPINHMEQIKVIEASTIPKKSETISSVTEKPIEVELQEYQIIEDRPQRKPSHLEELLFKNDEAQELSLKPKIQTNLSTSPSQPLSKENFQEKQLNTIIVALEKAGLNDDYIM